MGQTLEIFPFFSPRSPLFIPLWRLFCPYRFILRPLSFSIVTETTKWEREGTQAGRKAEQETRTRLKAPLRNTIFAVSSSPAHSRTIPRVFECSITGIRFTILETEMVFARFAELFEGWKLGLKRRTFEEGRVIRQMNTYSSRAISLFQIVVLYPSSIFLAARKIDLTFAKIYSTRWYVFKQI